MRGGGKPSSVEPRGWANATRLCDHPSGTAVSGCLERPTRESSETDRLVLSYVALLPAGFTQPAGSPSPLVSSYLTISPLPRPMARPCRFCGTFHAQRPWTPPKRRPANAELWGLPTAVSCEARTFLPGRERPARPRRRLSLFHCRHICTPADVAGEDMALALSYSTESRYRILPQLWQKTSSCSPMSALMVCGGRLMKHPAQVPFLAGTAAMPSRLRTSRW